MLDYLAPLGDGPFLDVPATLLAQIAFRESGRQIELAREHPLAQGTVDDRREVVRIAECEHLGGLGKEHRQHVQAKLHSRAVPALDEASDALRLGAPGVVANLALRH